MLGQFMVVVLIIKNHYWKKILCFTRDINHTLNYRVIN